jgi:hypothetical protein
LIAIDVRVATIYCTQVQLHCTLAEHELALGAQRDSCGRQPDGSLGGLSYMRCSEACRATALAATIIADMDMSYMLLFIGIVWVCVSEILIKDIPRLRQGGHIAQAREKEDQLAVLEKCMERLVATYPVLSECLIGFFTSVHYLIRVCRSPVEALANAEGAGVVSWTSLVQASEWCVRGYH